VIHRVFSFAQVIEGAAIGSRQNRPGPTEAPVFAVYICAISARRGSGHKRFTAMGRSSPFVLLSGNEQEEHIERQKNFPRKLIKIGALT